MSIFNSLVGGSGGSSGMTLIDSGTPKSVVDRTIRIEPKFSPQDYVRKRLLVFAWVKNPTQASSGGKVVGVCGVAYLSAYGNSFKSCCSIFQRASATIDSYTIGVGRETTGGTDYIKLTWSDQYATVPSSSSVTFNYEIYSLD